MPRKGTLARCILSCREEWLQCASTEGNPNCAQMKLEMNSSIVLDCRNIIVFEAKILCLSSQFKHLISSWIITKLELQLCMHLSYYLHLSSYFTLWYLTGGAKTKLKVKKYYEIFVGFLDYAINYLKFYHFDKSSLTPYHFFYTFTKTPVYKISKICDSYFDVL